jgi:hypothetical protein
MTITLNDFVNTILLMIGIVTVLTIIIYGIYAIGYPFIKIIIEKVKEDLNYKLDFTDIESDLTRFELNSLLEEKGIKVKHIISIETYEYNSKKYFKIWFKR